VGKGAGAIMHSPTTPPTPSVMNIARQLNKLMLIH